MITHEKLLNELHYDPETGIFTWKTSKGKVWAGRPAGCLKPIGYIHITFDFKRYMAHRLAWFYMTKSWPANEIDHRNRNRSDNRFCNLRQASRTENRANGSCWSRTGFKGVTFDPNLTKPFKARACQRIDGRFITHPLGFYATAEEAHAAYLKKATELHGDFASS